VLNPAARTTPFLCLAALLLGACTAAPSTPGAGSGTGEATAVPEPTSPAAPVPLATSAPPLHLAAPTETPSGTAAALDAVVEKWVRAGHFAGTVLVARDGQILLRKSYGLASLDLGVPNAPSTRFRIGSVTKQFTAAAVLVLQQRGLLDVHDPICRYLDDCPDAWRPITIHHLLTHSSGITNVNYLPELRLRDRSLVRPVDETIALFRAEPLDFPPGRLFLYSNSGYLVLGRIVEKVSGMGYGAFLRASIFEPLGMAATGYEHPVAVVPNLASGYHERVGGSRVHALLPIDAHAAGGVHSTVEDLYRWDRALYTAAPLDRRSLDAMFATHMPTYGYGWEVWHRFDRRLFAHGGLISGFASMVVRVPEERVYIAVLSNLQEAPSGAIAHDLTGIALEQAPQG